MVDFSTLIMIEEIGMKSGKLTEIEFYINLQPANYVGLISVGHV